MTMPPLPEPDTHCFDDDTGLDVWSHSPDQMRAYGEACAAAERKRKPLTEEQISNRLWEADWPEVMLSDFVRAKLRVFARAVERAHGIVEAP